MLSVQVSSTPIDKEISKLLKEIKDKKGKILVEKLRAATPVDTGRARDGWTYQNGVISNDVEYIDSLNQGTSKQAPSYFIERTLLSEPGIIPNGVIVKSI
jgi:hypothetical protein